MSAQGFKSPTHNQCSKRGHLDATQPVRGSAVRLEPLHATVSQLAAEPALPPLTIQRASLIKRTSSSVLTQLSRLGRRRSSVCRSSDAAKSKSDSERSADQESAPKLGSESSRRSRSDPSAGFAQGCMVSEADVHVLTDSEKLRVSRSEPVIHASEDKFPKELAHLSETERAALQRLYDLGALKPQDKPERQLRYLERSVKASMSKEVAGTVQTQKEARKALAKPWENQSGTKNRTRRTTV